MKKAASGLTNNQLTVVDDEQDGILFLLKGLSCIFLILVDSGYSFF